MGFALPSGVVNTDSAYYFGSATLALGPLVKQPSDQTLVVIDYTQVEPPISALSVNFTVDVTSNPALVVSYQQIDVTGELLSFLVSGGIVGQQYNLSIAINTGTDTRTDVLAIYVPSFGDCDCVQINPVPTLYTQLPLGEPTQGYANSAVRYFWGNSPPTNPSVMDQWYYAPAQTLYEWATDGTNFFWQTIMSANLVPEAPVGGLIFGRGSGTWQVIPIQSDANYDNNYYARRNGGWAVAPVGIGDAPAISRGYVRYNNNWIQVAIQTDVPNDSQSYVRSNQAWLQVPTPFSDAPQTNQLYSRINSNWQLDPIQTDAYPDGQIWGRQNYQWVPVPTPGIAQDAPPDNTLYGRLNGQWVAAYPASNPNNYQSLAQVTGITAAAVAPMMPRAGGIFTGGVQFNVGAVFPTTAQLYIGGATAVGQVLSYAGSTNTTAWVDPGTPEAPINGIAYARENGAWVPTASGAGLPEAPTDGTTYSRNDATWVHLAHTDITDWTATLNAALAPYALTASLPPVVNPSNTAPLMDGTAAPGTFVTYARGDHIHPTDTSRYAATNPSGYQTAAQVTAALGPYALTSAVPVPSNAAPLMNGTVAPGGSAAYSRADHVHPVDTSRYAATNPAGYQTAAQVSTMLGNFVPLSGATMLGVLTLVSDPSGNLDAATKQYVDNVSSNANIDCGTF